MGKPKVMVLGTFHMRYTTDMFRLDVGDIELAERQREIRQVIERVKAFKPTKMAFEVVKSENERLNEEYQSYQRGEFKLGIDEVYQFGFRIAEELEHDQVYPALTDSKTPTLKSLRKLRSIGESSTVRKSPIGSTNHQRR